MYRVTISRHIVNDAKVESIDVAVDNAWEAAKEAVPYVLPGLTVSDCYLWTEYAAPSVEVYGVDQNHQHVASLIIVKLVG